MFQDVEYTSYPIIKTNVIQLLIPAFSRKTLASLCIHPEKYNTNWNIQMYFPFEGWVNSTEGTPVTLSTQVFDIKGKEMIVVIGDESSAEACR